MEDNGWNPNIDLEGALEQLPDYNISFADYIKEIGSINEETKNSSACVTAVDPICRLNLATMIAPHQKKKIGVLKTVNDDKADDEEVTHWLRLNGLEAENSNMKLNPKKTRKMVEIASGKLAVSGVKNMFVDDDFFKLKAKPSQLLPFKKQDSPSTVTTSNGMQSMNGGGECSRMDKNVEAEDRTSFYTPRQLYNLKKQQLLASKKTEMK